MIKSYQNLVVGFSGIGFNAVTENVNQGDNMPKGIVPVRDRMTLLSQFDNLIIDTTRLYYHKFKEKLSGSTALN
ncbi:MAG: hypothetical protein ACQEQG_02505 [Bacillota bacterium]